MKAIACGFSCGPCFLAELMAEPVRFFGRKGHPGEFEVTTIVEPVEHGPVMTAEEAAAFGAFIREA